MLKPHPPGLHRQTCKACGRPDYFNFKVPERIWRAVVPGRLRRKVVCLGCFDGFAVQRGIRYARTLRYLYFAGDGGSARFGVDWAVNS
jgi:hypothetical protein